MWVLRQVKLVDKSDGVLRHLKLVGKTYVGSKTAQIDRQIMIGVQRHIKLVDKSIGDSKTS